MTNTITGSNTIATQSPKPVSKQEFIIKNYTQIDYVIDYPKEIDMHLKYIESLPVSIFEKANKISAFIQTHFKYGGIDSLNMLSYLRKAEQELKQTGQNKKYIWINFFMRQKALDCDMANFALMTILRDRLKLPTRMVTGIIYLPAKNQGIINSKQGHGIAQVWINNMWHDLDATPNRDAESRFQYDFTVTRQIYDQTLLSDKQRDSIQQLKEKAKESVRKVVFENFNSSQEINTIITEVEKRTGDTVFTRSLQEEVEKIASTIRYILYATDYKKTPFFFSLVVQDLADKLEAEKIRKIYHHPNMSERKKSYFLAALLEESSPFIENPDKLIDTYLYIVNRSLTEEIKNWLNQTDQPIPFGLLRKFLLSSTTDDVLRLFQDHRLNQETRKGILTGILQKSQLNIKFEAHLPTMIFWFLEQLPKPDQTKLTKEFWEIAITHISSEALIKLYTNTDLSQRSKEALYDQLFGENSYHWRKNSKIFEAKRGIILNQIKTGKIDFRTHYPTTYFLNADELVRLFFDTNLNWDNRRSLISDMDRHLSPSLIKRTLNKKQEQKIRESFNRIQLQLKAKLQNKNDKFYLYRDTSNWFYFFLKLSSSKEIIEFCRTSTSAKEATHFLFQHTNKIYSSLKRQKIADVLAPAYLERMLSDSTLDGYTKRIMMSSLVPFLNKGQLLDLYYDSRLTDLQKRAFIYEIKGAMNLYPRYSNLTYLQTYLELPLEPDISFFVKKLNAEVSTRAKEFDPVISVIHKKLSQKSFQQIIDSSDLREEIKDMLKDIQNQK